MGVLPGKLQHIQQLIAHLFSPLKHTIKCQLLTLQKAALIAVNHTHTHTLTASIMTECGVLAVKTKPSPLAPLTSAPSSGEEAW